MISPATEGTNAVEPGMSRRTVCSSLFLTGRTGGSRERTDRGFVDVRDLKPRGVELVAGAHGADDGRACRLCLFHQRELALYGVDRVHDIIILRKIKGVRGFGQIKGMINRHPAIGVDVHNPRLGNVGFVLPDRGAQGDDLTVEVALGDRVVVDQIERTDARTRQRLHHIAADAADAEHRHTRVLQALHGFFSEQQLRARKCPAHSSSSKICTALATQSSQEQMTLPVATPFKSMQTVAPQRSRNVL